MNSRETKQEKTEHLQSGEKLPLSQFEQSVTLLRETSHQSFSDVTPMKWQRTTLSGKHNPKFPQEK